MPFTPDVLQWHFDEITELPPGAMLLASSTRYPHQAFRVGDRRPGGCSSTSSRRRRWSRGWAAATGERLTADGWDVDAALARWDLDTLHADLAEVWQPFAARFAELARVTPRESRRGPARPAPGP